MNCSLNNSINHSESSSYFYITQKDPPDFILPPNFTCRTYYPFPSDLPSSIKDDIIKFILDNDTTDSGNTTELSLTSFNRLLSTPLIISVLYHDSKIIGTMFSIILRASYKSNLDVLTSYTTFLCISPHFRNQGLAMILIRSTMKEGFRHDIHHGYYMTPDIHHPINTKIDSWYRPINIKKCTSAGFVIQSFSNRYDKSSIRDKIAYHISRQSILPIKATPKSYLQIKSILKKGDFFLNPTETEYINLCKCFDIYIVGSDAMFMLFPMTLKINSTGKRVNVCELVFMIGDVINQALWIANGCNYDIMYGWIAGDITESKIKTTRGLITTAKSYLELYNTREMISLDKFFMPLF